MKIGFGLLAALIGALAAFFLCDTGPEGGLFCLGVELIP